MRALLFALPLLLVAAAVALSPGCGKSGLSKAYDAYEPKIEPLLDRQAKLYVKMLTLYNEQVNEDTANPERYGNCVLNEAVPLYDEIRAKFGEIEPGDPGLLAAHEALTQFAAERAGLAHYLAENLDVLKPSANAETLSKRQVAAQMAVDAYQKSLDKDVIADSRFNELAAVERDFAERCMRPFAEGRMSSAEVQDLVKQNFIPRVQKLRATKFADDPGSQALREAVATSAEFYAAFAENLPLLDRNSRFGAEVTRRTKAGDELLKKFRDEMAGVRHRM